MGKVFVSYSGRDRDHLSRLREAARRLEEAGLVELWHDEAIDPGAPWAEEIRRNLDSSRLVLALVSPDFLASPWCLAELERAFELRDRHLIDVVPVILRPCEWRKTFLGAIQALPHAGAAIECFPDQRDAWEQVVAGLERLLSGARTEPALPTREELAERYAGILEAEQRLMILAPWREGLEELALEVAHRTHGERVTLLRPPVLEEMAAADFYAELAGEPGVTSATEFRAWLKQYGERRASRAAPSGSGHLVVLPYFGGPQALVRELGNVLRGLFDQLGNLSLLTVGQSHCAALLGDVQGPHGAGSFGSVERGR